MTTGSIDAATLRKSALDFLNEHRKAVFATVDDRATPHTSFMLYAVDDDFNVYFGTRTSFKKYEQIRQNPSVSMSVIEEGIDPLRVVDVRGKAEIIPKDEQTKWFDFLKTKNPSKYYVEDNDDFVMLRVRPSLVRMLDARSGELTMQSVEL